jgi:hypothetical protein
MKVIRVLRILRGALGLSFIWATVWGVIAAAAFATDLIGESDAGLRPLELVRYWATYGAISGFVFAGLLLGARRRKLQALPRPRVAIWGAAAGIVVPIGFAAGALSRNPQFFSEWNPLPMLISFAVLGVACGVGSVSLARRADSPPRSGNVDAPPTQVGEAQPDLSRAAEPAKPETKTPRSNRALLLTNAGISAAGL